MKRPSGAPRWARLRRLSSVVAVTPRVARGEVQTYLPGRRPPAGRRVLVFTRSLPWSGGSGEQIRNLHNILALQQHATVGVFAANGEHPSRPKGVRAARWHALGGRGPSAFVPRVTPRDLVLASPPGRLLRARLRIAARLFRPHLAVVEGAWLAPFLGEFAALRIPVVVDEHNVEAELLRQLRPASRDLEAIARMEGDALRVSLQAWACSDEDANMLQDLYDLPRLPAVMPNVIDVERYSPVRAVPRPQGIALTYAALLSFGPNRLAAGELAQTILPALREIDPSASLAVVGRGGGWLPEGPGLIVPGRVADVRPWLARSSFVALPIRTGSGTRLKALEAFASGRPVVATALAVAGLGVADGVHYVRAETPAQFVAALAALNVDRAKAEGLAAMALAHVTEHFSLDVLGQMAGRWLDGLPPGVWCDG